MYVVSLINPLRLPAVVCSLKDKTSPLSFITSRFLHTKLSFTYKSSTVVNLSILTLLVVSFNSLILAKSLGLIFVLFIPNILKV